MTRRILRNSIFDHRSVIVALGLPLIGVLLLGASQAFTLDEFHVQWERVVGEVGALFLVVGVLHWLFELGLRKEMLREVAQKVLASAALHDAGVEDCRVDSKAVDDRTHWSRCSKLIVGRQYSNRFLKEFGELLAERSRRGLETVILVLDPDGTAAEFLSQSKMAGDIKSSFREMLDLIRDYDHGVRAQIKVYQHNVVFRYAFIHTSEHIWVTFYANSQGRSTVPAIKLQVGTDLYDFFDRDIKRLLEQSNEIRRGSWASRSSASN